MSEVKRHGREPKISLHIDPFILEGGHTIREIAEAVNIKLGGTYDILLLINNVRSRIFVLGKKGYTVTKDGERRVFAVPTVPAEEATSATVSA